MTIISISKSDQERVRRAAVVAAQALLGVALGVAAWFGLMAGLEHQAQRIMASFSTPVAEAAPPETPAPVYDPAAVPEGLAELYEKNPDARQFVIDYPEQHDRQHEIDLSALADSEGVPRLYQWDERWGYESYNENFFALAGCGPTCLSMVDIYLTGRTDHDPLWLARFAEQHGYNEVGNGSKWTLFSEGGPELGLQVTGITLSEAYLTETLSAGTPIICIMGPGDFTEHGHYLVLTGIDDAGNITLNDPNSRTRSERTWTYDELAPQIRGGWAVTKDNAKSVVL